MFVYGGATVGCVGTSPLSSASCLLRSQIIRLPSQVWDTSWDL